MTPSLYTKMIPIAEDSLRARNRIKSERGGAHKGLGTENGHILFDLHKFRTIYLVGVPSVSPLGNLYY